MPELYNKYLIILVENSSTILINNVGYFIVNEENEKLAIRNMLINSKDNYNRIYSILLEMNSNKLTNNNDINLIVDKLVYQFRDNLLDDCDEDDPEYMNFILDNIDDFTKIFYSYLNIEFIKINIIE